MKVEHIDGFYLSIRLLNGRLDGQKPFAEVIYILLYFFIRLFQAISIVAIFNGTMRNEHT